jgi:hypothetical protein
MKHCVNRAFTEYAKSFARRCEEISKELGIPASVYYSGYLDAVNNGTCHNWFRNDPNPLIILVVNDYLKNMMHRLDVEHLANIDKKFIIVTEVHNAQADFPFYPNIHYIYMGPNLVANHEPWSRVLPQNHKNLLEGPHWISVNNNARPQRTLIASILANYNLGIKPYEIGMLRINIDNHGARLPINNFEDWKGWYVMHSPQPVEFSAVQEAKLKCGYQRLEARLQNIPEDLDYIPGFPKSLDNFKNFDVALRPLYRTAVLEIVNETVFFDKGVVLSEKYLNTIVGFAFPILIGNAGTVQCLRDLGLDVFDDVINHDYDEQTDCVYRAFLAIENNLHLLSNPEVARDYWLKCYNRFKKNYDFVRYEFAKQCRNNFEIDLRNILQQI